MQPTGIEPALKASEAFVLSVRLRLQILQNCYITLTIISQNDLSVYCELKNVSKYQNNTNLEKIKLKKLKYDFHPLFPTVIAVQTVREYFLRRHLCPVDLDDHRL